MGFFAFLGGFLAVAAAIGVLYSVLRQKIRGFSRQIFGTSDIRKVLETVDTVSEDAPRSLNGCDNLLLPQILADFPDFDVDLVKTYARDALREKLASRESLTIYNVVLAKYLRAATQKTVVLQAALSYQENGKKQQKRYELHYTYLVSGSTETVAANCPNCGGALGYGQTVCPYCDSRVTAVLGNAWKFTDIRES